MRRKKRNGNGCVVVLIGLVILVSVVTTGAKFLLKQNPFEVLDKAVRETLVEIPYQEQAIPNEEMSQKFYYQQLTAEVDKTTYKEILQGLRESKKEIYIHEANAERIHQMYTAVLYDFPELFWCAGRTETTGYEQGGVSYSILIPEYQYEGAVLEEKKAEVEEQAAACIAGMNPESSVYEKIKYVYEYIILTTDYKLDAPDNQNIYSVFVNKQSVCAGYARAFQYILNRCEIEAAYITGTVDGGQPHAWNIVKCDGAYYQVDPTWGDPVFLESEGTNPVDAAINYDYLMCTDAEIYRTHVPDQEIPVPACTSNAYNYYALNGTYYETYDRSAVREAIHHAIDQKQGYIDLKFSGEDAYLRAKQDMIDNLMEEAAQYLGRQYGLQEIRYYYQNQDAVYRFSLYWEY